SRPPGDGGLPDRLGVGIDEDLPAAMRDAVRGRSRRAMNGTTAGTGIRRDRARVEGGIPSGVPQGPPRPLAVLLDLEQRAAAHQPEVAAGLALEVVVHVHVLVR